MTMIMSLPDKARVTCSCRWEGLCACLMPSLWEAVSCASASCTSIMTVMIVMIMIMTTTTMMLSFVCEAAVACRCWWDGLCSFLLVSLWDNNGWCVYSYFWRRAKETIQPAMTANPVLKSQDLANVLWEQPSHTDKYLQLLVEKVQNGYLSCTGWWSRWWCMVKASKSHIYLAGPSEPA